MDWFAYIRFIIWTVLIMYENMYAYAHLYTYSVTVLYIIMQCVYNRGLKGIVA